MRSRKNRLIRDLRAANKTLKAVNKARKAENKAFKAEKKALKVVNKALEIKNKGLFEAKEWLENEVGKFGLECSNALANEMRLTDRMEEAEAKLKVTEAKLKATEAKLKDAEAKLEVNEVELGKRDFQLTKITETYKHGLERERRLEAELEALRARVGA